MRSKTPVIPVLAALAPLAFASPAGAQDRPPPVPAEEPAQQPAAPGAIDGVSARDFIANRDVYGAKGEDLGDVRDLLVGADGRVVAVVIVLEGDRGFGGAVARLPLDGMESGVIAGEPAILLPVSENEIADYALFGDGVDRWPSRTIGAVPPEAVPFWRMSSRIGEPVHVRDADGYAGIGVVEDFILVDDRIRGVVVLPDLGLRAGGRRVYAVDQIVGGLASPSDAVLLKLDRDQALAVPPLPVRP